MPVPPQFQKSSGRKPPPRVARKVKARRVPAKRAVYAALQGAAGKVAKKKGAKKGAKKGRVPPQFAKSKKKLAGHGA